MADVVDVRVPVLGDARVRRPGGRHPGARRRVVGATGPGRSAARRPPRGRCRTRSRSGTGARSGRGTSPSRPGPRRRRPARRGSGSASATWASATDRAVDGSPAVTPSSSATGERDVQRRRLAQRDPDRRPRIGPVVGAVVLDQPGQGAGRPAAVAGGRGSAEPARAMTSLGHLPDPLPPVQRLATLLGVVDDRRRVAVDLAAARAGRRRRRARAPSGGRRRRRGRTCGPGWSG